MQIVLVNKSNTVSFLHICPNTRPSTTLLQGADTVAHDDIPRFGRKLPVSMGSVASVRVDDDDSDESID
ncbi:hypothetical protein E0I00_08885 [Pseudomonas syringae pv. actinidiae]|nr:hypothetical protein [Pseudomonas syringae pv. actinidiae]